MNNKNKNFHASRLASIKKIKHLTQVLNKKEILILKLAISIAVLSLCFLTLSFLKAHFVLVPLDGGEYTEGLIGSPAHINPLYYGISDVDGDIQGLIFSSLFKRDKDGSLIKDLVENYSLSASGLEYLVKIKSGVRWQDGESVTASDVVYTFNAIKDAQYQSPLRSSFSGVQVEQVDDNTLKFKLAEKYSSFPEMLTFGIIPEHLWYSVTPQAAPLAELNIKPVGSGRYKFKSLAKDKLGNIKIYTIEASEDYYGSKPKLSTINFKFFPSFEEAIVAMNNKDVDGLSYIPVDLINDLKKKDNLNIYNIDLLQANSLFLNQDFDINLKSQKFRQALLYAIDRDEISRAVNAKIAANVPFYQTKNMIDLKGFSENMHNVDQAIKLLKEDKKDTGVGLTIITTDSAENQLVAQMIKSFWEKIGINVKIESKTNAQIQSEVLKQKNFSVLLYNMSLNFDQDPYVMWHSSQIGPGGLNLSAYRSNDNNAILQELRQNVFSQEGRLAKYLDFSKNFIQDTPAIFLYYPKYQYVQTKDIRGFDVKVIAVPYNRFANIDEWYVLTGRKFSW